MFNPRLMGIIVVLISSVLLDRPASAQMGGAVLPSYSSPYGESYSDWSAEWWKWAFSVPADVHPLLDEADCSAGQSGRVWFLGGRFVAIEGPGTYVGEADRECVVPPGTALFFPIINFECDSVFSPSDVESVLRDCANYFADHLQDLEVIVDGVEIDHLGLFRFESDLFTIDPLPYGNILGAPADATGIAVSDGYWIMLRPLSRGTHEVHFEGSAVFTPAEDGIDLTIIQDIAYTIVVGN